MRGAHNELTDEILTAFLELETITHELTLSALLVMTFIEIRPVPQSLFTASQLLP